jgi:hypothetical protein
VAVADLERVGDDAGGLGRVHLEDAEAELRDGGAVVESEERGICVCNHIVHDSKPGSPLRHAQAP